MSDSKDPGQVRLERRSPFYWRVTFDHPPLNIFGPETIPQLNEIITALETDEHVKVVVFDSAVEGFFVTHYDFLAKLEDTTSLPPGPTGLQALPDMLARLSRAPVVSIVSIRGRATGVGSELSLARDMRFACRERAILSQWEVGAGLVVAVKLGEIAWNIVCSNQHFQRSSSPIRRGSRAIGPLPRSCVAGRGTRCFCRCACGPDCFVRQTGDR